MAPSPVIRSLRRLFFASFFLVLPLYGDLSGVRAQAAGEADVFTVDDVAVDATAATAAAARETALARGQAEAFNRLLARLTVRSDASRLPRPSAAEIADLVRGIELDGEKTSAVRYIASLRVRFRADGVRNLLRRSGIPFAETRSKPMLILPLVAADSGPILWEQDSDWRAAWAASSRSEGLVPLVVPVGDLDDLRAISAEQAMAGDTRRLSAIAARYNAGDVVVAVATPQYSGESVEAVQVSINRFSALGQDETVLESYGAEPGKSAWTKAMAGVAANLEDTWKRASLIRYDSQRSLTATIMLAGIDELVEVRRRLANVAILRQADLVYLARNEAQFRFDYFGDERQLASAFAQNDLVLEQGANGWRFRPRTARGAPTGRLGTLPGATAPGAAASMPATELPNGTAAPDMSPDLPDEPIIVQ